MKKIFQLFAIILAMFALVACSDQTADLKSDLSQLNQATTSATLNKVQKLQQELLQAKTPKERADIFVKIGAEYNAIHTAINDIKLKSSDTQDVKKEFLSGTESFSKLMTLSAKYAVTAPESENAQKEFMALQQSSVNSFATAATQMRMLQAKLKKEEAGKDSAK